MNKVEEYIEQIMSFDPFVTDSTNKSIKDVPEKALFFAEVTKIGGMTYKDGDTLKHAKVTEVKSVGENLIPEAVQALDGYGLGVNENIYNYIDYEQKRFVKRVGKVDLSTIYWEVTDNSAWYTRSLVGIATPNIGLCDKYVFIQETALEVSADKAIQIRSDLAFIKDTSITDARQITGTLIYELATPEVTDISDLITDENLVRVKAGGTVTFVNEHAKDVPNTIIYQVVR